MPKTVKTGGFRLPADARPPSGRTAPKAEPGPEKPEWPLPSDSVAPHLWIFVHQPGVTLGRSKVKYRSCKALDARGALPQW